MSLRSAKTFLYLPIEIKAREYNSKLLFSCIAAREGFAVVLGNRKRLQKWLRFLPPGIFLEKGLESPGKAKAIRSYRSYGNKIAAWDEEGLVYKSRDIYKKNRVNIEAFRLVDLFFAWGQEQMDIIIEKFNEHNLDPELLKLAGNPRVDLLNSEFKQFFAGSCASLKKKYGPFILINSNFTIVNPFEGHEQLKQKFERWGYLATDEDKRQFDDLKSSMGALYGYFVEMLPLLSARFSDYNIIVRPHPAESHASWEEATGKLDNVMVINDGSNVIPWIMASEALIHNDCTTGIEAYLLEKDVLAYCPISSDQPEADLPNQLSRRVYDLEDLVAALDDIISGKRGQEGSAEQAKKEIAKKHIYNIGGPAASELILAELKKVSLPPRRFTLAGYKLKKYYGLVLQPIKTVIKKIIGRAVSGKGDQSFVMHKFQGLSREEISNDIKILSEINESFKQIEVRTLEDQCFYIEMNNNLTGESDSN